MAIELHHLHPSHDDEVTEFVCEKCAHEIGGMPPYERFKAFCPNCKKLACTEVEK